MIIDASALFKLIVKENESKQAEEIFLKETAMGEPIAAPDVVVSEVLNALWTSYALKKSISRNTLDSAVIRLDMILENIELIPAKSMKDVALKVAILKNISVYDSMYISATLLKGAPLLSFDKKMLKKASEMGVSQIITNEHT